MNTIVVLIVLNILPFLLYFPLNRRTPVHYWSSKVDTFIPYISVSVIPYILLFPLLIISVFLLWNTEKLIPFLVTMLLASYLGLLFWHFVPNGVKRPFRKENDICSHIINWIYTHDGDGNGFPSSHVFLSLICAYYASLGYFNYGYFFVSLGILIAISTILTKQHYFVDVFGGVIVFMIAVWVTPLILALL